MVSTICLFAFSGSKIHDRKKAGSTPNVAMSFALMFTASQPIRSIAPVMGSTETIRELFPTFITAPSNPAAGPKTTSLRFAPRFLKITSLRTWIGIFPKGKLRSLNLRSHILLALDYSFFRYGSARQIILAIGNAAIAPIIICPMFTGISAMATTSILKRG